MNSLIENLINGNLDDAKRQAKRFAGTAIILAMLEDYGFSHEKALRAAQYLKGDCSFQVYCDAK